MVSTRDQELALRFHVERLLPACAASVLFTAQKTYAAKRAEGGDALDAALAVVDRDIVNNPNLPLSANDRRAYASKIKADLGAEEAQRRQDLAIARSAAREAQNAMQGGVRVAGSLAQEVKGLEKALDTADRRVGRERSRLDKADSDLPARRTAAETRAASREASAGNELRRAVSRLAQEGYGIRLARDDAQGFAAWTDLMKRTFTMEFLGHLADHAAHSLDALKGVNGPLANFLERHQISAGDWDRIRVGKPLTVEGATFLDTDAIGYRSLAEKLLGAIVEERAFAVLEPDARIRAVMPAAPPPAPSGAKWCARRRCSKVSA